jgi:hypothetical protein
MRAIKETIDNLPTPLEIYSISCRAGDVVAGSFELFTLDAEQGGNQITPSTQAPVLGATQNYEKKSVVTLEALGDVWILVQNAQGVELQWQNLRKGERLPVAKQGSISITSSNGKALRVLDHEGRSLKEPSENEGIAILRLP